jgi:hypothetical protein
MMVPGTTMLWLVDRLARLLGLDLGIFEIIEFDSLDEREVTDQLHYGRD